MGDGAPQKSCGFLLRLRQPGGSCHNILCRPCTGGRRDKAVQVCGVSVEKAYHPMLSILDPCFNWVAGVLNAKVSIMQEIQQC